MQIDPVERMDAAAQIVPIVTETAAIIGTMTGFTVLFALVCPHAVFIAPSGRMDLPSYPFVIAVARSARHALTHVVVACETRGHGRRPHAGLTRLHHVCVTGLARDILNTQVMRMCEDERAR
jgi:hypothetical protein